MEVFTLVLFLIPICFVNSQLTFDQYKQTYGYTYSNAYAAEIAQQTFNMNSALTALMNSLVTLKNSTFELGVNEFSGIPFKKFEKTHLGVVVPEEAIGISSITYTYPAPRVLDMPILDDSSLDVGAADSKDYRNITSDILNQKNCGCCWAFSVLGTLESRMIMKNSSYNTTLSPQYLVDCDTNNNGCNGGWPLKALNWIVQSGENSVPALSNYPYYGFKTKCKATPKISMNINATVQNFTNGNENMMKEIVSNVGPVTAVISATSLFQLYKSGVFYDTTCNNNCGSVNHAVIIVGYGRNQTSNKDYWIVKNSWGKSWGENGYIYMSRNNGNNCNIACYATYAI